MNALIKSVKTSQNDGYQAVTKIGVTFTTSLPQSRLVSVFCSIQPNFSDFSTSHRFSGTSEAMFYTSGSIVDCRRGIKIVQHRPFFHILFESMGISVSVARDNGRRRFITFQWGSYVSCQLAPVVVPYKILRALSIIDQRPIDLFLITFPEASLVLNTIRPL